MTQPAVCEIDDCGVQAIGRCSTCNHAFCRSHQAISVRSERPYVDLCMTCYATHPEKVAHDKVEAASKAFTEADQYFQSGSALQALESSKLKQVPLYRTNSKSRRTGLFGRDVEYYEEGESIGQGWLIGKFNWEFANQPVNAKDVGVGYHTTLLPTIIMAGTSGHPAAARPYKDGYEVIHGGNRGDEVVKMAQAIKQMTRGKA